MRQTSSHAALVGRISREILPPSAPSARRVERSGTGGGANEKSTPIGVLSVGSPCWTRTSDTLINSQVLYRLS